MLVIQQSYTLQGPVSSKEANLLCALQVASSAGPYTPDLNIETGNRFLDEVSSSTNDAGDP